MTFRVQVKTDTRNERTGTGELAGPGSTLEVHQFGDRKVRMFIGPGIRLAVID